LKQIEFIKLAKKRPMLATGSAIYYKMPSRFIFVMQMA